MRSFVLAVTTIALSVLLVASCAAAAQTPGETPGQASAWIPKDEFIRQEKAFMDSLVLLKVVPPDSGRRVSVLHELYQFFTGQRDAGGGGAVLREGPGESYRVLGDVHPGATFAALGETASAEGRQWYHVFYLLARANDICVVRKELDAWICADFAKASELEPDVRKEVEFVRFSVETRKPRPVPVFSFREPVVLRSDFGDGVATVTVPAGTPLALAGAPECGDGCGDRLYVSLCENLDCGRSRELGLLPVDELEARSGYLVARPEDLPVFSFSDPVSLQHRTGRAPADVLVPAGTRMVPLGYSQWAKKGEGIKFSLFIALWEPLDGGRLRWLGYVPAKELKERSGYQGEQALRNWLAALTSEI